MFCLFFILLISCSDDAALIADEETNVGVTVFVAEIASMCGLRCDGIAALLCAVSCNALPGHSVHVDSFHILHAYIFIKESHYSKSGRLCLCES